MAGDQFGELGLGDVAGGELGPEVAHDHDRHPDVLLDQAQQGLVGRPGLVELQGRDAQPLLVDLGGIGGIGPGDPATDIGVMADGDPKARRSPPK